MAPALIDLTGQQFGQLEVLKRDPNATKRVKWLCRCTCHQVISVLSESLRNGETTRCPRCRAEQQANELKGKIFGRLTVLERAFPSKAGLSRWRCQCICGAVTIVQTNNLKGGYTKSCGHCQQPLTPTRAHDLTGQRFNQLTVIALDRTFKGKGARWRCRCDCGAIVCVRASDLKNNHTRSCGCRRFLLRKTSGAK